MDKWRLFFTGRSAVPCMVHPGTRLRKMWCSVAEFPNRPCSACVRRPWQFFCKFIALVTLQSSVSSAWVELMGQIVCSITSAVPCSSSQAYLFQFALSPRMQFSKFFANGNTLWLCTVSLPWFKSFLKSKKCLSWSLCFTGWCFFSGVDVPFLQHVPLVWWPTSQRALSLREREHSSK